MMNKAWIWVLVRMRALARDERGGNFIEYALLVAVAVLIVVIALQNFSNAFVAATTIISDQLGNALAT